MRAEKIQLAKAIGIEPEDLDDVDLLWRAITQIQIQNTELEERRADSELLDWIIDSGDVIMVDFYKDKDCKTFEIYKCYWIDGLDRVATGATPREALTKAMKAVRPVR